MIAHARAILTDTAICASMAILLTLTSACAKDDPEQTATPTKAARITALNSASSDGSIKMQAIFSYDTAGRLTSIARTQTEASPESPSVIFEERGSLRRFEYSADGSSVRQIITNSLSGNTYETITTDYALENGRIVSHTSTISPTHGSPFTNWPTHYTYSTDGHLETLTQDVGRTGSEVKYKDKKLYTWADGNLIQISHTTNKVSNGNVYSVAQMSYGYVSTSAHFTIDLAGYLCHSDLYDMFPLFLSGKPSASMPSYYRSNYPENTRNISFEYTTDSSGYIRDILISNHHNSTSHTMTVTYEVPSSNK